MIINGNITPVLGAYATAGISHVRPSERPANVNAPQDEAVLSSDGQSFSTMLQKLRSMKNSVRTDKINALQSKIDAGTYNIEPDKIAARMLEALR